MAASLGLRLSDCVQLRLHLSDPFELHVACVFDVSDRIAKCVEHRVSVVEDVDNAVELAARHIDALERGTRDAFCSRDRAPMQFGALCHPVAFFGVPGPEPTFTRTVELASRDCGRTRLAHRE